MDLSDFDLMIKLPGLANTTILDDIIKKTLDEEDIKSGEKFSPCEFTEHGLSSLPRVLPDEGESKGKRRKRSCHTPPDRNIKRTMNDSKPSSIDTHFSGMHIQLASLSQVSVTPDASRVKHDMQHELPGPSRVFNDSSVDLKTVQVSLPKRFRGVEESMGKQNISIPVHTMPERMPSTEHKSDMHLLDLQQLTSAKVKQVKLVGGKLHFNHKVHYDESTMSHTIQKLLHAYAKYYPDMPRPGTEAIRVLRQEQSETRQQWNSSKVDIDAAFSLLANNGVKVFENITVQSVKYGKQIPGFLDFHCADQISLIKESRQEGSLFYPFRCLNNQERVCSPIPGIHFTFEDSVSLFSRGLLETVIEEATQDIWQTITEEEEALLMALVLTDADRCESLHNREQIQETHRHLVACLEYVVDKGGRNVQIRQEEMKSVLQSFRCITTKYNHFIKGRLTAVPAHADNQTLKEIF